jgi:hypothetical protein
MGISQLYAFQHRIVIYGEQSKMGAFQHLLFQKGAGIIEVHAINQAHVTVATDDAGDFEIDDQEGDHGQTQGKQGIRNVRSLFINIMFA